VVPAGQRSSRPFLPDRWSWADKEHRMRSLSQSGLGFAPIKRPEGPESLFRRLCKPTCCLSARRCSVLTGWSPDQRWKWRCPGKGLPGSLPSAGRGAADEPQGIQRGSRRDPADPELGAEHPRGRRVSGHKPAPPARRGLLPYRKLGTHRRLSLTDVLRYEAERDRQHARLDDIAADVDAAGLY
jgi:hypothetical protein